MQRPAAVFHCYGLTRLRQRHAIYVAIYDFSTLFSPSAYLKACLVRYLDIPSLLWPFDHLLRLSVLTSLPYSAGIVVTSFPGEFKRSRLQSSTFFPRSLFFLLPSSSSLISRRLCLRTPNFLPSLLLWIEQSALCNHPIAPHYTALLSTAVNDDLLRRLLIPSASL